jgi:Lipase maturation factor
MDWLQASDYWLARWVFERLLAAIYLLGFLTAAMQFPALLGEHGLLPAPRFLRLAPFRETPSLFHAHYSDRLLQVVAWTGMAVAALLLLGAPQAGPAWLPMLAWLALWALYLSIVNIGQTFYAFGWESLLLEAGFMAIFLGPASTAPPTPMLWLLRWLLFRVEFGAGLIKIRHDPCWRNLTCLYYHHETQPMPNPLSWYFHHLPEPVHRLEVLGNHVAQLVVPFGLFAPQPVAGICGLIVVIHQVWLVLSGNFAWLNWLTLAIALIAFDDRQLGLVLPIQHATLEAPAGWYTALVLVATALLVGLSYWPARNLVSRNQLMNFTYNPFHLVNSYGAFGSITRERHEIVVEGTDDNDDDDPTTSSTVWKEYEFKGKPGDPRRCPPQVAPYHLRLDWLMWFAAMSPSFANAWFLPLVVKLLENDRPTLKLLRHNPFPERPPKSIRARLMHYRYTTWRERRETGAWWVRQPLGVYLPSVRLESTGEPELVATRAERLFSP